MVENSKPWNGTVTGDAGPYSDADWQELYRYIIGWRGNLANNGVFLGSGTQPDDGLRVLAQSPTTTAIDVYPGSALVQGIAYISDAVVPLTVAANASGNPRIDTVILSADYALQTVRLVLKQGTPAVTPAAPALTQVVSVMWEIPIADIAVADSFVSISQANITPRQEWVNAPPGVYLDSVLNNSGVTLEDGDVVIWDTTTSRAVTTTTTLANRLVAGVWRGRTTAGGYGRVQIDGIGHVRASAAVTIGDLLVVSATIRNAVTGVQANGVIGYALETTSGSGFVLTHINVHRSFANPFAVIEDQKATNTAGGSMVATTWTTRDLNTEVVDANGIVSIAANQFTPIAGVYKVSVNSPFTMNAATGGILRLRIRNVTSGAILVISPNTGATTNQGVNLMTETQLTANGTDAYDVQYYSTQARATNGLGSQINEAGAVERYTQIYLEKTA